jgi:hypothetical protein
MFLSLNSEKSAQHIQGKVVFLVALWEILSKLNVFTSLIYKVCVFKALSQDPIYRLCPAKVNLTII